MVVSVSTVAKEFNKLACKEGMKFDNRFKLHFLLYLVQGRSLEEQEIPMINDLVYAGPNGPFFMVHEINHLMNEFYLDGVAIDPEGLFCTTRTITNDPLVPHYKNNDNLLDEDFQRIRCIWNDFASYSTKKLKETLTEIGSPWHQTRYNWKGSLPKFVPIDNDLIKDWFKKKDL